MRSINKMTRMMAELAARYPQAGTIMPADSCETEPESHRMRRKVIRCERALARILNKFIETRSEKPLSKRYRAVLRRYGADRVNTVLSCTAASLSEEKKSAWGTITDEYGKEVQFKSWSPRSYKKIPPKARSSYALKFPPRAESVCVNYLPKMADKFAAMERSNCDMSRPYYEKKGGKEVLRFAIPVCAIETCEDGRAFLRLPRKGTKDGTAWEISLTKYSEIAPDCDAKAPDGRVVISVPKGMHMKVFESSGGEKQSKFRITAESLSSILYHATEEDYAPDEARPRLTKEEKERFDAATKGCVYGKQTRDLFDGKEKKGDLGKSRENFMARLAYIFDGNKESMAHVFECSGLNNGMSPEERNALADAAGRKVTKHYSDIMDSSSRREKRQKTACEFASNDKKWAKFVQDFNQSVR